MPGLSDLLQNPRRLRQFANAAPGNYETALNYVQANESTGQSRSSYLREQERQRKAEAKAIEDATLSTGDVVDRIQLPDGTIAPVPTESGKLVKVPGKSNLYADPATGEPYQADPTQPTGLRSAFQTATRKFKGGREVAVVPGFGERDVGVDPRVAEKEAKAQQKAQFDDLAESYWKEGRPFRTDESGRPIPRVSDEAWAKEKQAKEEKTAQEARVKALKADADRLNVEAKRIKLTTPDVSKDDEENFALYSGEIKTLAPTEDVDAAAERLADEGNETAKGYLALRDRVKPAQEAKQKIKELELRTLDLEEQMLDPQAWKAGKSASLKELDDTALEDEAKAQAEIATKQEQDATNRITTIETGRKPLADKLDGFIALRREQEKQGISAAEKASLDAKQTEFEQELAAYDDQHSEALAESQAGLAAAKDRQDILNEAAGEITARNEAKAKQAQDIFDTMSWGRPLEGKWGEGQKQIVNEAAKAGLPPPSPDVEYRTSPARALIIGAFDRLDKMGIKIPRYTGMEGEPEGDRSSTIDQENLAKAFNEAAAKASGPDKDRFAAESAFWSNQAAQGMTAQQWKQQTGEDEPPLPQQKPTPNRAQTIMDRGRELYNSWAKGMYTDDWRNDQSADVRLEQEATKAGLTVPEAREALQTFRQLDWSSPRRDPQTGKPIEEKARVLPNGDVTVNPSLWGDAEQYQAALKESGATPGAMARAMEQFPKLQEIYAERAVETLSQSANIPGADNFMQWRERKIEESQAKKDGGFSRMSPAKQAIAYMDEMKNRSWFRKAGDQIASGLIAGFQDIATQVLGVGGMLGSETLANLAAENAANTQSVVGAQSLEGSDTDYALRVMGMGSRMAPAVAAMIAGAGATGGGLTAASIMAGSQTAGSQFADLYRQAKDAGMDHGDAWKRSALPAALSGVITGLLTKGMGATGLERVLADPTAREAARKTFLGYVGQFAKGAMEEIPEEVADEFFSQAVEGAATSPDPVGFFQEFASQLPELAGVTALMGGAGAVMQNARQQGQIAPEGMAPAPEGEAPVTPTSPEAAQGISEVVKNFVPSGQVPVPQAINDVVTKTKRRPEVVAQSAASGLVKVAQGTPLESLNAAEQEALGLTNKDGKLIPNAKTTPLVYMYKGKPVIRNEAAEWLQEEGQPLIAEQIKLTEEERKAQIDNPPKKEKRAKAPTVATADTSAQASEPTLGTTETSSPVVKESLTTEPTAEQSSVVQQPEASNDTTTTEYSGGSSEQQPAISEENAEVVRSVEPSISTGIEEAYVEAAEPTLTPTQQDQLARAEEAHQKRLATINKMENDPEMRAKQLKAEGMKFAAVKRQITGKLTGKEKAAKEKYEASNYQGKPVSVNGRNGTVSNVAYGRVKVKFDDGSTKSFPADQIKTPVTTPANVDEQLARATPKQAEAIRQKAAKKAPKVTGPKVEMGQTITDEQGFMGPVVGFEGNTPIIGLEDGETQTASGTWSIESPESPRPSEDQSEEAGAASNVAPAQSSGLPDVATSLPQAESEASQKIEPKPAQNELASYESQAIEAKNQAKTPAQKNEANRKIIGARHLSAQLEKLKGVVDYEIATAYKGEPIPAMMVIPAGKGGLLAINPAGLLDQITSNRLDAASTRKAIDKFIVHELIHKAALARMSDRRVAELYNALTPEAKEASRKLYLAQSQENPPPLNEFQAAHEWFAQLVEARMSGEISNQALIEASDDPAFRDKLVALLRDFVAQLRELAGIVKDKAMAEQIRTEADAVQKMAEDMVAKAGLATKVEEMAPADPNIGREWDSVYGRQRIVSRDDTGLGSYDVQTVGTNDVRRYSTRNIDETIQRQQYATTPEYVAEQEERKARAEGQAKAAKDQEEAKIKAAEQVNAYFDAIGFNPMQRGKMKAALDQFAARRSSAKGKEYTGPRYTVVEQMVADGFQPQTEQVPAIKEPTGIQWNRMNERQQQEYERKAKAAGTKIEYRIGLPEGGFFEVTKAEHDYAKWLATKAGLPVKTEEAGQAAPQPEPSPAQASPTVGEAEAPTLPPTQAAAVAKEEAMPEPAKQAAQFDSAAAKGQKKFLLAEVAAAVKAAPRRADMAQDVRDDLNRLDEIVGMFAKQDRSPLSTNLAAELSREAKELNEKVRQAVGVITIEVPGDGTFTILNEKGALAQFQKRADKFPVSAIRDDLPAKPTAQAPTAVPAIKKLKTTADVVAAIYPMVSSDETRGALVKVKGDGTHLWATDGKKLIRVEQENGGGKGKEEVVYDEKGNAQPWPEDERQFDGNQVIPDDKAFPSYTLDTGRWFSLMSQARAVLKTLPGETENIYSSTSLYLNPDGSLGVFASDVNRGDYAHNIQPEAKFLASYNPEYIQTILRVARNLGHEQIELRIKDDVSPATFRAGNALFVLMPMGVNGAPAYSPQVQAKRQTPPITTKTRHNLKYAAPEKGKPLASPPQNNIQGKTKPFKVTAPFMQAPSRKLMAIGRGVWLTRSGDIIPVETDHETVANELLGSEEGLNAGYKKGWTRVLIMPSDKQVWTAGPSMTPSQKRNINDWAMTHGYEWKDGTGNTLTNPPQESRPRTEEELSADLEAAASEALYGDNPDWSAKQDLAETDALMDELQQEEIPENIREEGKAQARDDLRNNPDIIEGLAKAGVMSGRNLSKQFKNPNARELYQALTVARDLVGGPETLAIKELREWAIKEVDKDPQGALDRAIDLMESNQPTDIDDQSIVYEVIERLAKDVSLSGDKSQRLLLQRLGNYYLDLGTNISHQLRARKDPLETPQDRWNKALRVIFGPTEKVRRRLRLMPTQRQKDRRIAQLEAQLAESDASQKRAIEAALESAKEEQTQEDLIEQEDAANEKLKEQMLKRMGVSEQDLTMSAADRYSVQTAILELPAVREALDKYPRGMDVMKLALRGFSDRHIAGALGMKEADVAKFIQDARGSILRPAITEEVKAGRGFGDFLRRGFDSLAKRVGLRMPSSISPVAQQDAAYMKVVEAGDMEKAQQMVDEAAKNAGYNVGPVFHNTHSKGITSFKPFARAFQHGEKSLDEVDDFISRMRKAAANNDPGPGILQFRAGTFFALNPTDYSGYGPNQYRAFLRVQNPVHFTMEGRSRVYRLEKKGQRPDAFYLWNLHGDKLQLDEIAVILPEQIKSADPVTRDASGKVIPLSQRFNTANNSILYAPNAAKPLSEQTSLEKKGQLPSIEKQVDDILNFALQPARRRNSGKLISKVFNTPSGQKVRIHVPFDPDDMASFYAFAREFSTAKSGVFDKLYEYWINWPLLSGPQTQVANISGNAAQMAWHYTAQRLAETAINTLYRDPNSAQLGEFKHLATGFFRSIMPALDMATQAFLTEGDAVRHKYLNEPMEVEFLKGELDKVGGVRPAVGGKLGRLNRLPGRLLRFADAFFKTAILHTEAAAIAYRRANAQAKKQGLTGAARAAFIESDMANTLNNPTSNVWAESNKVAEELLFQDENAATEIVESILGSRGVRDLQKQLAQAEAMGNADEVAKLKWRLLVRNTFHKLVRLIFPFQRTPTNIIKTGLRKAGGSAIAGLLNFGMASYAKYKDDTPIVKSYSKAQQIKDISETLLAGLGWYLLSSMFEGDDDDEKKKVLMVGNRPYAPGNQGEREAFLRQYGGPNTIIVRNDDGTIKYNVPFGRYEPVATLLSAWIDGYRNFREVAHRKEQGDAEASYPKFVGRSLLANVENKSFLQGLSGIMQFWRDMQEGKSNQTGDYWTKQVINGIVPNIIKQPLRNWDELIRETKTAGIGYTGLPNPEVAPKTPAFAAQPKITTTGEQIRKGGSGVRRLFFQANAQVTPQPDALLLRANRLNPRDAWFPQPLQRDDFYARAPGAKRGTPGWKMPITDPEKQRQFAELAGQEYSKLAKQIELKTPPSQKANPPASLIEAFQKARTAANELARKKAGIKGLQNASNQASTTPAK